MTPDQENQLLKDTREARDTGLRIEGRCDRCHEWLAALTLDVDGVPGNGDHPGLKGRMVKAESGLRDIKKTQAGQTKWMRGQLTLVIGAFLAMIAKWKIWG